MLGALYSNRRFLLRKLFFTFITLTCLVLQSTLSKTTCQLKIVFLCNGRRNTNQTAIVKYVTRAREDAVRNTDFNIELLFKALGDPTRLRLIHLLGDDEVCVCSVVERLKANQPKVSRHLAYLKRAGLVTTRREGKWVHYRLVEPSDPSASKIFREVRDWLANSNVDSG